MSEKFEDKVKDILGNFELEPGEAVWQQVKQEIKPAERKRRFIFWWMFPVVLGAAGVFYYSSNHSTIKNRIDNNPGDVDIVADIRPKIFDTVPTRIESSIALEVLNDDNNEKSKVKRNDPVVYIGTQVNNIPQQENRNATDEDETFRNDVSSSIDPDYKQAQANKSADGTSVSNVENEFMPADNVQADSSMQHKEIAKIIDSATDNMQPITVKHPSKKWKLGIYGEIGASTLIQEKIPEFLILNSGSFQSIPNAGSSINPMYTNQSTNVAGITYSVGVLVSKSVTKRFDFSAAASYLHQSFSVQGKRIKDSANQRTTVLQNTNYFTTNYVNLSIGGTWYFTKSTNKFGVNVAIENTILLSAKQRITAFAHQPLNIPSLQKNNITSQYRTWLPNLNVGITSNIKIHGGSVIQVKPFARYSLKPLKKNDDGQLISFGLSTSYFF